MAGKAIGPPYKWEHRDAETTLLDARRQELLAVQAMAPEQMLEWNQLTASLSSSSHKGLASISSTENQREFLEGPFGKPTISGADAAALVGYSLSDVNILLEQDNLEHGVLFSSAIQRWHHEGRVNCFGSTVQVEKGDPGNIVARAHEAQSQGKFISVYGSSAHLLESVPVLYELVEHELPVIFQVHVEGRQGIAEVLAARGTGAAILWAYSAQEAYDLSLVAAHISRHGKIPIVVCQDSAGVANDLATVNVLDLSDSKVLSHFAPISRDLVEGAAAATAAAVAVASNAPSFASVPDDLDHSVVTDAATVLHTAYAAASQLTGRRLSPMKYHGPGTNASGVAVVFGPGAVALQQTLPKGSSVGVLEVGALRPFSADELVSLLPPNVEVVYVTNVCSLEPGAGTHGSIAEGVVLALHRMASQSKIVQLNVHVDGHGFTPTLARAVHHRLNFPATIGNDADAGTLTIRADDPGTHLAADQKFLPLPRKEAVVWTMTSDLASVRAASATLVSALNNYEDGTTVQGGLLGAADSGNQFVAKLQVAFGTSSASVMDYASSEADLVVCNAASLLLSPQYDVLGSLRHGGVLFVNCPWGLTEFETMLPDDVKHVVAGKTDRIFHVDVNALAAQFDGCEAAVLQAVVFNLLTDARPETVANAVLSKLESSKQFNECRAAIEHTFDAMQMLSVPHNWKGSNADEVHHRTSREAFQPIVEPNATLATAAANAGGSIDASYTDLLQHVFGNRVVIADAGDATSLFEEKFTVGTEYNDIVDTIFAKRPEFCFGVHLAKLQRRQQLVEDVKGLLEQPVSIGDSLRSVLAAWYNARENPAQSKLAGDVLVQRLSGRSAAVSGSQLDRIWEARDLLPKQTKWIVGSDSWSTDIGYSGIHHVIASGQNVNVLVLETTPHVVGKQYGNHGKTKKDIGLYCMNYGNTYVASISQGDSRAQAVRALAEADAFDGPSVVIAYAPSAEVDREEAPAGDGGGALAEEHGNVEVAGALPWPMYRWNPQRKEDSFQVDCQNLRKDLEKFTDRVSHLSLLSKKEQTSATHFKTSLEDKYASHDVALRAEVDAANASGAGTVDMSICIAYGSDSGKGAAVAARMKQKAELRKVREVRSVEANELNVEDLASVDVLVFVMSTAGQGEMCGNAKQFWSELSTASKSSVDLKDTRFAVFGLGDSAYWGSGTAESAKYFCLPAKELDTALTNLGGKKVLDPGLGDDQHANGLDGAFVPWESTFFKTLGINSLGNEEAVKVVGMVDDDVKRESNYLRGTLLESLADTSTGAILPEDTKVSKFHGIYMQDDRDIRPGLEAAGKERAYTFMIRIGIPGGVCSPAQYLAMSALARSHCSGTLKLTTRQAFQFHGIIKKKLKPTVQIINRNLMDTLAACGDVNRNVIASPNPFQSAVHAEVLAFAQRVNLHLKPQTQAYHEIWLDKYKVGGDANAEVEPLYGDTYLPRKFKIAIAVPPMNDVDVFSHCLGYVAIVVGGKLLGFNVCVGGGMGTTHGNKKTYPRLSDVMGFCTVEQAVEVGEHVMTVQRDYGDRKNRKHARLKYTVEDHGIDWYRAEVERRAGFKLGAARPFKFESNGDRFGWTEGIDGKFHYGLFVENGRLRDTEDIEGRPGRQLRTGMDEISRIHTGDFRLTANQNCIIGSVTAEQRPIIQRLLDKYNMDSTKYSGLRLNSMACVALPTCALAMAESERYLPSLVGKLDKLLEKNGLAEEPIMIRMSGCPNGCSRPFMAEIVFVGKAPETYNMYLGGGFSGNRLAKIYKEGVKEAQILRILEPMFSDFATKRTSGEHFGDFVIRMGIVQPTLAGRVFHEVDEASNKVPNVPPQVYW